MRFDTALLHGGIRTDDNTGATLTPIFQSSAFAKESAEQIERVFANRAPGFAYSRISNPTVAAFERRITYIEEGAASVATSSGMAAISMTLLNILSSGDEIISMTSVFGGTLDLFRDLETYGIHTKFVEEITEDSLRESVTDRTRAVFAETIGNPKLNVLDIKGAAELIHSYGLPFILDNTSATAYLVKGVALGADIIINSSSKYINGSSNSIGGVVTDSGSFAWDADKYPSMKDYAALGRLAFSAKLRNDTFRNMGACQSPFNAYLNMLGLETLSLRMERHCVSALRLAESLEDLDGVREVNYPLLRSSRYYDIAMRQHRGKGGGIFTIRLFSKERAFLFINSLKYALNLTNIGDSKTLVVHPASTIYAHSNEEERAMAGVYEDTVRVSVGLEDIEDLKEDFLMALEITNERAPVRTGEA